MISHIIAVVLAVVITWRLCLRSMRPLIPAKRLKQKPGWIQVFYPDGSWSCCYDDGKPSHGLYYLEQMPYPYERPLTVFDPTAQVIHIGPCYPGGQP